MHKPTRCSELTLNLDFAVAKIRRWRSNPRNRQKALYVIDLVLRTDLSFATESVDCVWLLSLLRLELPTVRSRNEVGRRANQLDAPATWAQNNGAMDCRFQFKLTPLQALSDGWECSGQVECARLGMPCGTRKN